MKVGFDPSYRPEDLHSEQARAEFLTAALDTGVMGFILEALGVIVRAQGVTQVAGETGLSEELLGRLFEKDGNPELSLVLRVVRAVGLTLAAAPADPSPSVDWA